jgi:hypothetical protein
MPCEKYKSALVDLAISGAEPDSDLRAHLDGCNFCRAALRRERVLFSSIDAAVQRRTNTEVPGSLLPGLRERLAQESVHKPVLIPAWILVTASALIVVAASWIFGTPWPRGSLPRVTEVETAGNQPRESLAGYAATFPIAAPASQAHAKRHAVNARTTPQLVAREPEVLVPPDEREAFASFLAGLQQRKEVAQALLNPVPEPKDASFPLDLIQIARLEIKALEGQDERPEQFGSQR